MKNLRVSRNVRALGLGALTVIGVLAATASPAAAAPGDRRDNRSGSWSGNRGYGNGDFYYGSNNRYDNDSRYGGRYNNNGRFGNGRFGNDRSPWGDFDGDGIRNNRDRDIDGDGVNNARDRDDYSRRNGRFNNGRFNNGGRGPWGDFDRDGIRNRRDRDDDNDGRRDSRDDYDRNPRRR